MNAWGIDLTDMPRVLETGRGTPSRWLYAWEDREDAARFAHELRSRTRDRRWRVRGFTADRLPRGPLGPVEIDVGRQRDGCTYELHPNSREMVRRKFPDARQVPSVFVGHELHAGPGEDSQEAVWGHVAAILTGLDEDELEDLSGYRVYDPENGKVLREPEPSAAGPNQKGAGVS